MVSMTGGILYTFSQGLHKDKGFSKYGSNRKTVSEHCYFLNEELLTTIENFFWSQSPYS